MAYLWVGTVKPVHTKSGILGHLHASEEGNLDGAVVEKSFDIAIRQVLGDDEEVAR
jgi:hypothetical protein